MTARVPWWLAVFAAAFALRLGFLFLVDEPLLYTHQYNYFNGGLKIAEHPDPWTYILSSDEWHIWGDGWTMAPLYHVFVGAVFRVFGAHLRTLQVLQCVLDAMGAVMVGALGRAVAGPRGAWAGMAYAVYWPAVEMPGRTLTENLHTPLLLAGLASLAHAPPAGKDAGRRAVARAALGGFLIGLSALARAVSAAFLPLAALWRWRTHGGRPGRVEAAVVLLAGAAAILPWTARNAVVIGDPVLIETVGIWNVWTDNAFVDAHTYDVQALRIHRQPTPEARRALAMTFARRGLRESPGAFARKVWDNFEHFFRPEGLHQLLTVEQPRPAWRHAAAVVLDDALLVGAVLFFTVLVVSGRVTPAAGLVFLWTGYYLFMLVVVFHNEIRYRSAFVPFLLAGAAGGAAALLDRTQRRRPVGAALAVGSVLAVLMVIPFAGPTNRALRAKRALRPALEAIYIPDMPAASTTAFAAAGLDPESPRPWLTYGRWLAHAKGRAAEAVEAYQRAELRRPDHWTPRLVLPRLLRAAGREQEADERLRDAYQFSWNVDPWLALEVAWRELPGPRTNEILLGRDDYGAVRGFLHPRGDHRWTTRHAQLILIPTEPGPIYQVTLFMGSPEPSPLASPTVRVRASRGSAISFTLTRDVRPYTFAAEPMDGPLLVTIDSPTWNLSDQPPEQGVRVDRMTVVPAR